MTDMSVKIGQRSRIDVQYVWVKFHGDTIIIAKFFLLSYFSETGRLPSRSFEFVAPRGEKSLSFQNYTTDSNEIWNTGS